MTLAELVKKNVECLPMREQARIFSESFRASAKAQEERVMMAKETCGGLSEADGRTMEEVLRWGRRIELAEMSDVFFDTSVWWLRASPRLNSSLLPSKSTY